jgi:glucosaminylphosphatidylinositol acyltransferase
MSEYGTHWNFFLTLSVTAFVSAICPLRRGAALAMAAALLATYQIALSHFGISHWLERHDRDLSSVLDANKEGISSLVGYVSLLYLGRAAACVLASRPQHLSRWTGQVVAATAAMWAVTLWLDASVHPISRRMCNVPYVTWIAALAGLLLGLGVLSEALAAALHDKGGAYPAVLAALSRRQLPVFLAANVLTGAVNLSMSAMDTGNAVAFAVLSVYTASWTMLALAVRGPARGVGSE